MNNIPETLFMRIFIIISCFVFFAKVEAHSQVFKIMFYNVENFFDTKNDPRTNDDNFTPDGENRWTKERFIKKRNNICKVIVAAGKGHIPDIAGLCEVENKYVLQQLIDETPLAKYEYGIVHYDSPDRRGIDVALLYRKSSFVVSASKAYPAGVLSRDILYVKGYTNDNDTLHLFVNHFPSKWGGADSENARTVVVKTLKNLVDSIFTADGSKAKICIMGDFNDYPDSKPVKYLGAKAKNEGEGRLYNLSQHLQDNNQGSIKYRNKWELIDLFFVSEALMSGEKGLQCTFDDSEIFCPDFLLEQTVGEGFAPKRTYNGLKYAGDFSDHLPITLTFRSY